MSTVEQIKAAYEAFVEENEKFVEKGNKAAGGRARKALMELAKLCKVRRAEILEEKKQFFYQNKADARHPLLCCIKHDSSCRSGRCGYCHIKVIKGDYSLLDDSYIRHADKELGYVHSCVTYPKSDLIIQIAIE